MIAPPSIETCPSAPTTPEPATSAGLSFFDESGPFGFENYGLFVRADGVALEAETYDLVRNPEGCRLQATLDERLEATLDWTEIGEGRRLLKVTLHNHGNSPLRLEEAAFGQFGATARFHPSQGHVLGWALRYAHTGNLRAERYPFCAADYPYSRPLPIDPKTLGDTEDQPFPALFLSNATTRQGLVIGAFSQQRSTPVFHLHRRPLFRPDAFEKFEIRWDFPQTDGPILAPGSSLTLETLYFQLTKEKEADFAFEDYLNHLAERHNWRGASTPINEAALHCTWNYGVFADQHQEPLLKTARFIAREFPKVRFFLVDDGYLAHTSRTNRVFLDRFYPDPEQELSRESWPDGMRGFSDTLRRLGLRPGLWWTPTVKLPCRLHDDHPDWFLRRRDGRLYLIGEDLAYLDYSNPEALDFLDRTLAVILGRWGMDACKIDFWSQNFETREALLQEPGCTSLEIRRRFFETVRRHLPPDGVIMSCIAMGMGNPFMGEWVDTYRCSMDISDGLWHEQINNAVWTLPLLGFGGRRSTLLNMDSVGINLDLPENENFFRLTWCQVTMGLIETGGRLEELPDRYRMALQKMIDRCDRGYPCRCPDRDAYTGFPLPEALYVDFPPASPTAKRGVRQALAFFNWSDRPKQISVLRAELGQPSQVWAEDFWTGERAEWTETFASIELPPRHAKLFDIGWDHDPA